MAGDEIQCLVCGKMYKRLGRHMNLHDLSMDDYRGLYGLPYTKGLCGRPTFHAYSRSAKQRIADGLIPPEALAAARAVRKGKARFQPFRVEVARENVAKSNGREPWPDSMFGEIVSRIINDFRSLKDVCHDNDIPGQTWFHTYCRSNPEAKSRFLSQLNEAPFSLQAKCGYAMGQRFEQEVRTLRVGGMSDKKIAKELGVTAMTVNNRRRLCGIS